MKKKLILLIIALGFGFFLGSASASAWVSLETATERSAQLWNSTCCSPNYTWHSRRDYQRINNDRLNILGQGWRNGVWGCRWTIVSSSTGGSTTFTRWHPDYEFVPGCGGV